MSKLEEVTGGYQKVPANWMPATGLRAIIQKDPCLLWLKFHGTSHGFEQDPEQYSFLEWIGQKGRDFEAAWIKNVAPEAVQALSEDKDVGRVEGVKRTLDLMARGVEIIKKAALWNAEERIYGSSDLIARTSWLYRRFPHLQPDEDEPDHYVVIDCKFTSGLDGGGKRLDLEMNSAQVRLYSFMLGKMQGYMPRRAYLATRDRIHDPLPVEVNHQLDGPLDPALAKMRDLFTHIKLDGAQYLPWRDEILYPNMGNKKDEPFHGAKKKIAELMPTPLGKLPHIGPTQTKGLKAFGYECLDDLLKDPDDFPFHVLRGVGQKAEIIHAVLHANRTGKPTPVAAAAVPCRDVELYIDYEFFSDLQVNFEKEWPKLSGKPMIFMIGVGWMEGKTWHFRRFVAARQDNAAEKAMFVEFQRFLHEKGVADPSRSVALYHWSPAEIWQTKDIAERHGFKPLSHLPWLDLRKVFADSDPPIGVPGAWGYGLKEIAMAVGDLSPQHRVDWVDLASGLSAMVMGWAAYDQSEPLASHEMAALTRYLESDVKSMQAILEWLRQEGGKKIPDQCTSGRGGWYAMTRSG